MRHNRTPIKRSNELAPLSRQHHEGLLLGWKIRQGITYGVDAERITRYCLWFWKTHLYAHLLEEEILFLPLVSSEHPMMVKMLDEHASIREHFAQLEERPDFVWLNHLAMILNYHIRFEERDLFPYIEQTVGKERLEEMGNRLLGQPSSPLVWTDEFWLKPRREALQTAS